MNYTHSLRTYKKQFGTGKYVSLIKLTIHNIIIDHIKWLTLYVTKYVLLLHHLFIDFLKI